MAEILNHAAPGNWTVLCDFDGTVALQDVVDGLLQSFGLPGWEILEDDWRAGRIGSRECMQGQVGLLDLDAADLDCYVDAVKVDPDFAEFVAAAQARHYPVAIVSDGIDYVIQRILRRHGLSHLPIAANHLVAAAAPRRWRLTSPHSMSSCLSGTCKCAQIRRARQHPPQRVLLIGDGRSDLCASGIADLVFAKNPLSELCRVAAIPYHPVSGFRAALELLPQLDSI